MLKSHRNSYAGCDSIIAWHYLDTHSYDRDKNFEKCLAFTMDRRFEFVFLKKQNIVRRIYLWFRIFLLLLPCEGRCQCPLACRSWTRCWLSRCPCHARTSWWRPKCAEIKSFVEQIFALREVKRVRYLTFWKSLNCWYLDSLSSWFIPLWIAMAGKFCSIKSWARAVQRWTLLTKITTWLNSNTSNS